MPRRPVSEPVPRWPARAATLAEPSGGRRHATPARHLTVSRTRPRRTGTARVRPEPAGWLRRTTPDAPPVLRLERRRREGAQQRPVSMVQRRKIDNYRDRTLGDRLADAVAADHHGVFCQLTGQVDGGDPGGLRSFGDRLQHQRTPSWQRRSWLPVARRTMTSRLAGRAGPRAAGGTPPRKRLTFRDRNPLFAEGRADRPRSRLPGTSETIGPTPRAANRGTLVADKTEGGTGGTDARPHPGADE